MPKPNLINKSSKERGSDPFVQAHRRSTRVFLKFFKFWKPREALSEVVEKCGSYMLMWNILGEQVSMMETWNNS